MSTITITEDYVSFEIAKLLNEKGFDENTPCKYADKGGVTEKWYDDYRERVLHFDWDEGCLIEPPMEIKDQYEIIGNTVSAPTLQMANKFLYKRYDIFIQVELYSKSGDFTYEIFKNTHLMDIKIKTFPTPEKANLEALLVCLTNLIE